MDGPVRIRQLEALNALCEQGSMTKAVQALKISQPAVSRLLSDLAGDLGFRAKGVNMAPFALIKQFFLTAFRIELRLV